MKKLSRFININNKIKSISKNTIQKKYKINDFYHLLQSSTNWMELDNIPLCFKRMNQFYIIMVLF